ncbi:MAG: hypothetical protein COV74_09080 [Candidatus Omnitrophica bacterium CG11_big_fil_rev_8_21_14_0_20_45_26]|uniref:SHS2 domain-containing protein n=1 Tax=Candidatus Abzuiibacterium crystallinum TaxID=1974748 RepID=A0A2H0LPB4_9BACT|nr:MAG: hypothetical protein COV74_09080 [Candidatus Omnitrophica bacterium CG11_big_fil_rev_8_21_14_0_20_45_26]PIW63227.1 MAG: hypothetical protein COW12_11055 [Candidatus Omnitrophica bacterium CG12_big_fil_rev_8_21_14_0_65_45_16]
MVFFRKKKTPEQEPAIKTCLIELTHNQIKHAVVSVRGDRYVIEKLKVSPQIENEPLGNQVKRIMGENPRRYHHYYLASSSAESIYKRYFITHITESRLKDYLKSKLAEEVGRSKDQLLMDYRLIETDQPGHESGFAAILVGAPADTVTPFLKELKRVNLPMFQPFFATLSVKRIPKMFDFPERHLIMVVDVGAKTTEFSMYLKENLVALKTIPFGTDEIPAILKEAAVKETDKIVFEDLIKAISETVNEFRVTQGAGTERVFVTGNGPELMGLDELLRNALNIPVKQLDYKKDIEILSTVDQTLFDQCFHMLSGGIDFLAR